MIRPHAALRRAALLSRAPSTTNPAARVPFPRSSLAPRRVSQQRWASGGGSNGNGKDFMGQLYDSTQARLQREKAEQARYAAQRDLTGRGSKGAGLLARKIALQFPQSLHHEYQSWWLKGELVLIVTFPSHCSYLRRHRCWLLRRLANTRLAPHRLHRTDIQDRGPETRHVDR